MGTIIIYGILPIIGGIILYYIISVMVKAPGNALAQKFTYLGILKGKSYSEIANACGNCSAVSSLGNGQKLRQWQATGYHIALIFGENDICLGVSSEISV